MAASRAGSVPPPPSPLSAGAYPPARSGRARPRSGGRTQQGTQRPASPEPAPAAPLLPRTRRGGRPGAAFGGIVAGLFLWPVAVNWIRGGQAQAIGWFGAKFFNEPYRSKGGPVAGTGAVSGPAAEGSAGSATAAAARPPAGPAAGKLGTL